jgi:hypothetical protein
MPTKIQTEQIYKKLKDYKKRYLKKSYLELDESATRLMINNLLTEVLGYVELQDIKTEYQIRGEYADYVIQLNKKKHFVVEVKAVQLDLSEKHLRQSIAYAVNEGIDWILLTNGRQVELYRVLFKKPIDVKKIFSFDLYDSNELKKASEYVTYLSKKSIMKDELNNFWARFEALEPKDLSKNLYAIEVIRFLKKTLKAKTGITFSEDDILDSVHQIITTKLESIKPKSPVATNVKKRNIKPKEVILDDTVDSTGNIELNTD